MVRAAEIWTSSGYEILNRDMSYRGRCESAYLNWLTYSTIVVSLQCGLVSVRTIGSTLVCDTFLLSESESASGKDSSSITGYRMDILGEYRALSLPCQRSYKLPVVGIYEEVCKNLFEAKAGVKGTC